MRRLLLALTLVALAVFAGAQVPTRSIEGTVSDNSGEPIIGATVLVKGTTVGTVTDFDGNFALTYDEAAGNTIVVSYTGYGSREVTLTNDATTYEVTLDEGIEMNEVVVTGLGIRKDKKALGYAVSTIDSRDIGGRVESDVSRILRGKAAGVDITSTSGLAGSGTNIIIRGYSSITGSNQPLFVVDGVPFNSDTNTDRAFQNGGATASSRFLDIDPNNIEEISVLKGLSATVLYGESGRNGVVLVTTKTGSATAKSQRKNEITVTQNVAVTEIANLPDYQDTYGNGFSGNFGWFFSNYGPEFANTNPAAYGSSYRGISPDGFVRIQHPYAQPQYADDFPALQNDSTYEYRPYDNVTEFFKRGLSTTTSINAQRAFDRGSVAASYALNDNDGFVESNTFTKHNGSVGATARLENGLTVNASLNAVFSDRLSPPAAVGNGSGTSFGGQASLFSDVLYTPRSIDLMNLPFESPIDNSMVYYRRGSTIQNPLWTQKYVLETENIQRFFGNVNLTYELAPGLTALYRFGADTYGQANERQVQKGGAQVPSGSYETTDRTNTWTDQILNLSYDKNVNEDFNVTALGGVNVNNRYQTRERTTSTDQFVFGLMNHSNFETTVGSSFRQRENTIGLFGQATVGFRSFAYVTVQGRNDWTSTLEQENRSIFYPSISGSFVPTDAFPQLTNGKIIDYLKFRVGYGTSAGYPDPYVTRSFLTTATNQGLSGGNGPTLNTNSVANRLGNRNLRAESVSEAEFGVEARFWDNRIGLDLSVYNKQSNDLIIDLDLDPATGFDVTSINGAEVSNKGIELGLNVTPIRGEVYWNIGINFTRNRNIVESIAEGIDQIGIAGFTNLGNFAIAGQPYGTIQGTSFERIDPNDSDSPIIVEQGTGEYREGADIVPIGDPNPDFTANWLNTISFKGINLGWQFQYTSGGDIYSVTAATMLARGLTSDTDIERGNPLILPGVTPEGDENTVQGYVGDYAFSAFFGANEGSIFDGTVIRLREVNLGYDLPAAWLRNTPLGRVSISAIGENLWFNAPNFPPGINFDPEVLSLGVGNGRGFDFLTGPTARKYGVNVSVTF